MFITTLFFFLSSFFLILDVIVFVRRLCVCICSENSKTTRKRSKRFKVNVNYCDGHCKPCVSNMWLLFFPFRSQLLSHTHTHFAVEWRKKKKNSTSKVKRNRTSFIIKCSMHFTCVANTRYWTLDNFTTNDIDRCLVMMIMVMALKETQNRNETGCIVQFHSKLLQNQISWNWIQSHFFSFLIWIDLDHRKVHCPTGQLNVGRMMK